jgi:hypothetical protein
MNLVGKILVVALLVMALVFSSFTLAVHATHKNWKLMVNNPTPQPGQQPGYVQILADRDGQIARMQTELTEKQRLYERTQRESEQVRGQLESQVQELLAGRTRLNDEITSKTNTLNQQIAAAVTSAAVLEKTQKQNTDLRTKNTSLTTERDTALNNVVKLLDELAQATGEWNRHEQRNKALLVQLAQYRIVMQDANLPLNLEVPTVEGLVTRTHTAEKLVEINLGTDDGLKPGVIMDVFRAGGTLATTRYLGQIRLSRVEKTEAVGDVIPEKLEGTIQENDNVITRPAK